MGLLFIGDAAHAMSPVGGVGINYAIQDAVAAVNLLGPIFASGKTPSLSEIKKVQRRREWATKLTQRFQLSIQIRMFKPSKGPRTTLPLIIRLCSRWRWISRLQGRFLGIGLRPEHVRFPPPETSNV